MNLLIVRHGEAGNQEQFSRTGEDDALRPLTPRGRKRMAKAAAGLKTFVPSIDMLASSPLIRAAQTADILCHEYEIKCVEITELIPTRRPQAVLKWLSHQKPRQTIVLVGHEPQLSALATWLITGLEESVLDLKKGGACWLEFEDRPSPGAGRLRWLMTCAQLRSLRD